MLTMGGPGPVKAGGLGPQSVRHNTLEGQCRGPGPAPRSGPGPLRGDSWGKEKLEEKMGMDATAARGKGGLWCLGQAANSIARGKSPLCSPWRDSYQRSHTHPGRGSREPQLQQADDRPSKDALFRFSTQFCNGDYSLPSFASRRDACAFKIITD